MSNQHITICIGLLQWLSTAIGRSSSRRKRQVYGVSFDCGATSKWYAISNRDVAAYCLLLECGASTVTTGYVYVVLPSPCIACSSNSQGEGWSHHELPYINCIV